MKFAIDSKILSSFPTTDIKIFFYNSWCEGTKIDLTSDFETKDLEKIEISGKNIYFSPEDGKNLDGGKVIPKTSNVEGHGGKAKYLFISPKIQSRCGCATSFSFQRKLIDTEKINRLKGVFTK